MYAGIDILTILLEAGADPNVANSAAGGTPLDLTLDKQDENGGLCVDRAKLLVEHGARLRHWTPQKMIHKCAAAITAGIGGLVEIYLKCDCDPNGHLVSPMQTRSKNVSGSAGTTAADTFEHCGQIRTDCGR